MSAPAHDNPEKKDAHGAEGGGHGGGGSHGGGGHGGGAHGGGSHEEHEGAPEWLISFADNTALMMGFFVILLAMNMTPKGSSQSTSSSSSEAEKASGQTAEQLDWALGVRAAFHNPVDVNSTNPRDKYLVMRLKDKMAQAAEDQGLHGESHTVESIRKTDYRNIYAHVGFERNSSALTANGKQSVDEAAALLRGLKFIVEVRGHCSADEAYEPADHGMQLSFGRAMAVAQGLEARGVERSRLRVIASGDNDRVKETAYDAKSHAQNQNVEVIVTDELAP